MAEAFQIIPAGAGSGKTYKIKSDLADWIRAGKVRAHRVMTVTFTEAAAGELKSRIRGALLAQGMVAEALALERAHVSTIHGLGLRILTEHAFAAGASPQPRHLSDAERELLIRQELARCSELDAIKRDPRRYGYTGSWGAVRKSAEDELREAVFKTIDLLRGLGDGGTDAALAEDAVRRLRASYGPVEADGAPLEARLQRAAGALLAAFKTGGTPFAGGVQTARKDFDAQLAALRAARDGDGLGANWKIWTTLANLRTKVRGVAIPERFVELSEDVMQAAGAISRHPGPLDDACTHLRALVTGAQAIMDGYAARKREAGVIDFADMIAESERLVRRNPAVLDAILAEVDCVIVDEFQDTNPVQFALLWRLAKAAPRVLLVGDTKQSIMGFQGADPRLSDALAATHADQTVPLVTNWRSDPRIMGLVNSLGAGLFGAGYVPLAAQRRETGNTCLEVLRVNCGRGSRAPKSRPEQHVAARIKALLDDQTPIVERHSPLEAPQTRALRPGDIAILCRTHSHAEAYADRLQDLGIAVRINRKGWLASPPVAAALNALALACDPADSHAALCLLTLGPAAMELQHAMELLTQGRLLDSPQLAGLRDLADHAPAMPLASLLAEVIERAGLGDWARRLPDGEQRRADLLRLEAEVANFEDAHRDMLAAAGFYGHSAPVFIGWLHGQRDERDFDRHPNPAAGAAEAVEIVTWHAAKGREWNVVVVTGLDGGISENPGTLRAEFTDFDNLDNVLDKAVLRYTPKLAIKEKQEIFVQARRAAAEDGARRLLYVALTRARDRLILEWPEFKLKKPSAGPGPGNFAEMLVQEGGLKVQPGKLVVGETGWPARILECCEEVPPEFNAPQPVAYAPPLGFGDRRAAAGGGKSPEKAPARTPWRVRPSQLAAENAPPPGPVQHIDLGAPVPLDGDGFDQADQRGTAWHLAFRTAVLRPDLQQRARAATGLDQQAADALLAQAQALTGWLKGAGYDRLHLELPVQIEEPTGAQTNAIIDLLAEGDGGFLIVDHKSGAPAELAAGFAGYRGQLAAYAQVIARQFPHKPVRGLAINWMRAGIVTWEKI